MGMDTSEGFNAGIHTSTEVKFELLTRPNASTPPVAQPPVDTGEPTKPPVPPLAHPIADPALRVIWQRFGDNPQDYAKFGLAGHNGVDFAVPEATSVYAVDDGVVAEVRNDPDGYGLYVKLRHAWGESLYAHLRGQGARETNRVSKRDFIGVSGNTGNSTGPHLHFAMRVNPYTRGYPFDGYVDPLPYLDAQTKPDNGARTVVQAIKEAAKEFGVDPDLLLSQAWAESSFRPGIDGGGLLQIGDDAWSDWAGGIGAVERSDALDNARVAAVYVRWLISRYGKIETALAAYNFGPRRVDDGEELPWRTQIYVAKVIHGRDLLKAMGA